MPIGPKRLPFFQHIAELRRAITVIGSTVIVLALVLYTWGWDIFNLVLKPAMPALEKAGFDQFNVLGPFGGFTLRFKVATYAAFVVGSPIVIWQVMSFFLPALKPKERRYVVPTFFAMLALFIGGIAFCYFVIVPAAFSWMVGQADSATVGVFPDAGLWFQAVVLVLIAFGIGFQLPVIVFYLIIFRVVPYAKLREQWRVVYVVLMIVAAITTPDWSPVTMGALAVALIILYEISMLLSRTVLARRIAAERRRAGDEYEDDDPYDDEYE